MQRSQSVVKVSLRCVRMNLHSFGTPRAHLDLNRRTSVMKPSLTKFFEKEVFNTQAAHPFQCRVTALEDELLQPRVHTHICTSAPCSSSFVASDSSRHSISSTCPHTPSSLSHVSRSMHTRLVYKDNLSAEMIHKSATNESDAQGLALSRVTSPSSLARAVNLVAPLSKARVFHAQQKYQPDIKLSQNVLKLDSKMHRFLFVGIRDSREPLASAVLIWLLKRAINSSKNINKQSAAAVNVLSVLFLCKGSHATAQAHKLAERTVQYADTPAVLLDSYIRADLVSCRRPDDRSDEALYGLQKTVSEVVSSLMLDLRRYDIPADIDTLDRLLTPPNHQNLKFLQAMIMLALLGAHPRRGVHSADAANKMLQTWNLFKCVIKGIQITDGEQRQRTVRVLGSEVDMWVA
ncbi:hypothetical protein K439DRAFT_1612133 [Ramaria rubella]|nr:hypothetical protein K439DRAFT_1612133 [Ramaria rubella]